jgi:putative alpha-1,2-mannosidase
VAADFKPFADAYKNVWDSATNYMCSRYSNGTFECIDPLLPYPFNKNYTEGNGAQYRWYVPHNLNGLVDLFPSPANFSQELNDFFELSELWPLNTTFPNWAFWAGNEPDILAPVQFLWAGNEYAYLTSMWFPQLLDMYYSPYPSGVPGNDDYGCMSSWVVWGYIGIYPVASTKEYALFAPRFDTIDVHVRNGAWSFTPWRNATTPEAGESTTIVKVRAFNRPSGGIAYVANISVNGKPLARPVVSHDDLLCDARGNATLIEFFLSAEASVFGKALPSEGGPQVFIPEHVTRIPGLQAKLEQFRHVNRHEGPRLTKRRFAGQ